MPSPLGSLGLPGLRFTRPAPLSLLYYNNGRLVKCFVVASQGHATSYHLKTALRGGKTFWPSWESAVPPRDVPSVVSGLPERLEGHLVSHDIELNCAQSACAVKFR